MIRGKKSHLFIAGLVLLSIFLFSEVPASAHDDFLTPMSAPPEKVSQAYPVPGVAVDALPIDTTRMRNLTTWKPAIQKYSRKHYGENSWQLSPACIVIHYTATADFPWNLVDSTTFGGEAPGLASHYIIGGKKIWRILPDNVRSRSCYGLNHRSINIELIALNSNDLSKRKETLSSCAQLVKQLMVTYGIPLNKVYSHEQVATMNRKVVPEACDLVNPTPYGKIDPGAQNMQFIKNLIKSME